ncbi:MAG: hypothetical protein U0R17_03260 [Acidimicrobiia bacterium]
MNLKIIPLEIDTRNSGIEIVDIVIATLVPNFINPKIRLLRLPPNSIGGDHKHERREAFFTFDKGVYITYENQSEDIVHEMVESKPKLFVLNPNVKHKIENKSDKSVSVVEILEDLDT